MTDIAFHTGLADPVGYACRLLRKAWRSGARVRVHADAATLDRLDRALWEFEPLEFIPHLLLPRDGRDPRRVADTPILLVRPGDDAPPAAAIGVSLGGADIPALPALERAIALVGADAADVAAGRQRWRAWKADGHALANVTAGAAEG